MDAAAIVENAGSTCPRMAFELGAGCELVTNAVAAFPTIALKTLRVFNSVHRPLLIYIQERVIHLE